MLGLFAHFRDKTALRIRADGAIGTAIAKLNARAGGGDDSGFIKRGKAGNNKRVACFRSVCWFGAACSLLVAQIFAAYRERAAGSLGVKAACAAQVCIILQGVRLFGNTLDRSLNKLGNIFDKLQCTRWANACTGAAARAEVIVDDKQPIIVARDRFVRANLKARHAARVTMTHAHAGRLVDFDRLLS